MHAALENDEDVLKHGDDLLRAEAAEEHQGDDGQVAVAAERLHEEDDLPGVERLYELARCLDPQLFVRATVELVQAEVTVSTTPLVVSRWHDPGVVPIEVGAGNEAVEETEHGKPTIDRCRLRARTSCALDEIDQVERVKLRERLS